MNKNITTSDVDALANLRFVLDAAEMTYVSLPEDSEVHGYNIVFSDDEPIDRGDAILLAGQSLFLFYLNFRADDVLQNLPMVMEFVTRANWGLNTGNFELDIDVGSLRFKTSLDFHGSELQPVLIRNLILNALDAVATYEHHLAQVIAGATDPKQAIVDAESVLP